MSPSATRMAIFAPRMLSASVALAFLAAACSTTVNPTTVAAPTTSPPTTSTPTTSPPTTAQVAQTIDPAFLLTPDQEQAASDYMDVFLSHLRDGNIEAARNLWTGYPDSYEIDGEDGPEVLAAFDEMLADFPWLAERSDLEYLIVPEWAFSKPNPLVVVTAPDEPSLVAPFLFSSVPGFAIERLPSAQTNSQNEPGPGSTVSPGDVILFPYLPLEGGARAFLGDQDLFEVDIEYETEPIGIRVTLPDELPPTVVLTLSSATPEASWVETVVYKAVP